MIKHNGADAVIVLFAAPKGAVADADTALIFVPPNGAGTNDAGALFDKFAPNGLLFVAVPPNGCC